MGLTDGVRIWPRETSREDMKKDTGGEDDQGQETVKKAGRGFIIITAAKVWFLLTSAVIQLGLPIFLGSPEKFGIFKIVTESIGLINMVMITGTLHAVSKLISEQPDRARVLVNMAVKMQLMLGLPVAVLYFVASPWIARWGFNDPSLSSLMQLSALIIVFYAFYAIFVGYFNGLKQFVRQATLDFTFSTVKMVLIVGLVLLGFGVTGAVAGFVASAGFIFLVAMIWVVSRMRRREDQTEPEDREEARRSFRRLLGYLLLIMLYTFGLNGLMRVDLFVLKAVAADVPAHLVGMEEFFGLMSNKFAGFYGAVLNIGRIPYQGVIAVTFVIFPLISEATFEEDEEKARGYIRETLRYCMIMIGVGAMLLAMNADGIVGGLYSEEYQNAALALAILSVGIIFFALLYVTSTMIIGSGHPTVAVVIMGVSLAISAVLNYLLVRWVHEETVESMAPLPTEAAGSGASDQLHHAVQIASAHADVAAPWLVESTRYMQMAATATLIAMAVGFSLSVLWLWHRYGARPPWLTILRLGLVAAILYGVDQWMALPIELIDEHGQLIYLAMVVAKMVVMGVVSLAVLAIGREFTATDWDRLMTVLGRGDGDEENA